MNALLQKFLASLSPEQFCITCIILTIGATTYGVKSFAKNSDVEEIREQQLSEAVFNLRVKQCEAIRKGTTSLAYGQLVTEAIAKYEKRTGQRARLLSCSEL
jgi:hypothetical protein